MGETYNTASNPRCLSSCEVQPHILNRCVRAVGHPERHLWVESLDLTDGKPTVAVWDDERLHDRAMLWGELEDILNYVPERFATDTARTALDSLRSRMERMEEVVEAAWNTPEHLRGDRINAALASLDQEEAPNLVMKSKWADPGMHTVETGHIPNGCGCR